MSLDKALEVNHVTSRVGDNVEVKCDVTGTPPPPIIWRRNDMDLSVLNDEEIKVRTFRHTLKSRSIHLDILKLGQDIQT